MPVCQPVSLVGFIQTNQCINSLRAVAISFSSSFKWMIDAYIYLFSTLERQWHIFTHMLWDLIVSAFSGCWYFFTIYSTLWWWRSYDVDDDDFDVHFAYLPNRFVCVCVCTTHIHFFPSLTFHLAICSVYICIRRLFKQTHTHFKGNQQRIIKRFFFLKWWRKSLNAIHSTPCQCNIYSYRLLDVVAYLCS